MAAVAVSQLQTPKYSATGRLFLVDPNRDFGLDPDRAPYTDPLRYTRMRAQLVASGPVFEGVAGELGTTAEDVADRVKVLPSRDADFVEITGVAETAEEADRLVSLVQREYQTVTTSAQQAPYRRAIEQLARERETILGDLRRVNAEIAASPGSPELLAERAVLRNDYRFLRARQARLASNAGLLGAGVLLAEKPVGSSSPVSPRPTRNAVIGGLLGFIVALGLLWWRAGREPIATSPELVEATLGGPLLAELPPPGRRGGVANLDDAFDQIAYAILAAREARLVLVAPARETDRRPSVVLRLAAALAAAGKRPAIVDASESRALTERVGRRNAPGLTDVPQDDGDALTLLEDIEATPGRSVPFLGAGRGRRTSERAAGYEQATSRLLREFDLVVVDAPQGRSLAAAASMEARSAAVVVASRETPLDAIAAVRRELTLLKTPLLGFVYVRGRLGADSRLRAVADDSTQATGARRSRRRPGR